MAEHIPLRVFPHGTTPVDPGSGSTMLRCAMLRSSVRARSFAMSALVHGSVAAAALVWVVTGPPFSGARAERAAFVMVAHASVEPPPWTPPEVEVRVEPLRPDEVLPPPLDFEPLPLEPTLVETVPVETVAAGHARPPLAHDPFADVRGKEFVGRRPTPVPTPAPAPEAPTSEIPATEFPASGAPQPEPESVPDDVEPAPAPPAAHVAPTPLPGKTPLPDYPASWARRGWIGEVTIELDVALDGSVTAARVVVSSGWARLDELARKTLAQWRFAPAQEGDHQVAGTFRQRIEFRPE
jgi:protein TonB